MDASNTKELRGDAPTELVQAPGRPRAGRRTKPQSRNAYVNKVLLAPVRDRLHEVSLSHRMLIGNPLYPESTRKHP